MNSPYRILVFLRVVLNFVNSTYRIRIDTFKTDKQTLALEFFIKSSNFIIKRGIDGHGGPPL